MLKKIASVLCAALGVVVIIMGISLNKTPASHVLDETTFRYSASDYDLPYAAFGGDFYTEIYKGSDYIVDILDDMNKSTETVVRAENGIYEAANANIAAVDSLVGAVYKVGSLLVIAVGMGILASGLRACSEQFTLPQKKEEITAEV